MCVFEVEERKVIGGDNRPVFKLSRDNNKCYYYWIANTKYIEVILQRDTSCQSVVSCRWNAYITTIDLERGVDCLAIHLPVAAMTYDDIMSIAFITNPQNYTKFQ